MKKINLQEVIGDINSLLEQEGMNPLPDLFKHMVLAIFRKGARTEDNFKRALEAAFSFLLMYGHITPQSNINNMQLTASGAKLNRRHAAEPADKSSLFDAGLQVVRQVG